MDRTGYCKKISVLITGGTGFVAPHLIQHIEKGGADIATLARSNSSDYQHAAKHHAIDVRETDRLQALVRETQPAQVYHLASISSVDSCWTNPRLAYEVNVTGTLNVFEAAMSLASPPKILNVSTSQLYAPSVQPLTESSMIGPSNVYAASKMMAELMAVQFRAPIAGGIITARSFNHTGPGQSPNFVLSAIAKQFTEIELGVRPPKLNLGNVNVKRDFTDVRDVVRAYSLLLEHGRANEVYNICSGVSVHLVEIIRMLETITGIKVAIEQDRSKMRTNDIADIVGDPAKVREETGWSPQIPLERTLDDLVGYWRSRSSAARATHEPLAPRAV